MSEKKRRMASEEVTPMMRLVTLLSLLSTLFLHSQHPQRFITHQPFWGDNQSLGVSWCFWFHFTVSHLELFTSHIWTGKSLICYSATYFELLWWSHFSSTTHPLLGKIHFSSIIPETYGRIHFSLTYPVLFGWMKTLSCQCHRICISNSERRSPWSLNHWWIHDCWSWNDQDSVTGKGLYWSET